MKKLVLGLLGAILLSACSNAGSSNEVTTVAETEVETSAEIVEETKVEVKEVIDWNTEHTKTFDPNVEFKYTGNDKYLEALTNEWAKVLKDNYGGEGAALIPTPYVVKIDDSDLNDIKVYGDFWIFGYEVDGSIFNMKNGGSYLGCIHLKEEDGKVSFVSSEIAEDGSRFASSLLKICGGDEELSKAITNVPEDIKDPGRMKYAKMYADANGLKFTAIKDFGWPIIISENVSDAEFVYDFYMGYYEEVRQDDSLNDMVERINRLKEKYMTKDTISKVDDMTSDVGADMVIHAQDVTDDMVKGLSVKNMGNGELEVSNSTDETIKVKVGMVNGKRMITDINY